METALHLKVEQFASGVLWNENGSFKFKYLPWEAQIGPGMDVVTHDVNFDGKKDIIIVGAMYQTERETTRADASYGTVLLQKEEGFEALSIEESGLATMGDSKSIAKLQIGTDICFIVGNNDDKLQLFRINKGS